MECVTGTLLLRGTFYVRSVPGLVGPGPGVGTGSPLVLVPVHVVKKNPALKVSVTGKFRPALKRPQAVV